MVVSAMGEQTDELTLAASLTTSKASSICSCQENE